MRNAVTALAAPIMSRVFKFSVIVVVLAGVAFGGCGSGHNHLLNALVQIGLRSDDDDEKLDAPNIVVTVTLRGRPVAGEAVTIELERNPGTVLVHTLGQGAHPLDLGLPPILDPVPGTRDGPVYFILDARDARGLTLELRTLVGGPDTGGSDRASFPDGRLFLVETGHDGVETLFSVDERSGAVTPLLPLAFAPGEGTLTTRPARLRGTLTAFTDADGVAEFEDVTPDCIASGYVIRARALGATGVSAPFNVQIRE